MSNGGPLAGDTLTISLIQRDEHDQMALRVTIEQFGMVNATAAKLDIKTLHRMIDRIGLLATSQEDRNEH